MSNGEVLAVVTITKVDTGDDVSIYVDATAPDGNDEPDLCEVLGMIELGKSILLTD